MIEDLASVLGAATLLNPFQTWDGDLMENMLVKQENR
jgi:hypothetical protein